MLSDLRNCSIVLRPAEEVPPFCAFALPELRMIIVLQELRVFFSFSKHNRSHEWLKRTVIGWTHEAVQHMGIFRPQCKTLAMQTTAPNVSIKKQTKQKHAEKMIRNMCWSCKWQRRTVIQGNFDASKQDINFKQSPTIFNHKFALYNLK